MALSRREDMLLVGAANKSSYSGGMVRSRAGLGCDGRLGGDGWDVDTVLSVVVVAVARSRTREALIARKVSESAGEELVYADVCDEYKEAEVGGIGRVWF